LRPGADASKQRADKPMKQTHNQMPSSAVSGTAGVR
jgi:hypothetical protein